jgi:hypothetical protein
MPNADNIPVIAGSGNVFADLGFADPEALQMKAELTRQIYNQITALGLTQPHSEQNGQRGIVRVVEATA